MIGFQPYETFQLLMETGGIDRANTLLVAACDAFSRRRKPPQSEIEQFETLAERLFHTASPSARYKAAATLGHSDNLTEKLELLVIGNIGEDIGDFLVSSTNISDQTLAGLIGRKDIKINASIARRPGLPGPILTNLFQTNSRKVYRALASNMDIAPKGPYLNALARSAQMDHQVAWSLAARPDFDAGLLAPAFFDLREADRIKVIEAFSSRRTPATPVKKTIEQLSVINGELTKALMKLFTENRRPEVANLLAQVTGLDEVRCGQIAHDTSGAALFVILRGFGCTAYDGLKVLIHATSHDEDRSEVLAAYAKLFYDVSVEAMNFLLSAWRGEVNMLDLAKPEYLSSQKYAHINIKIKPEEHQNRAVHHAMEALERIGARRAS